MLFTGSLCFILVDKKKKSINFELGKQNYFFAERFYYHQRNTMVRKILKVIALFFASVVAFFVILFCCEFVLSHVSVAPEAQNGHDVTIYLYSNGVHTDLVLPVRDREIDWSREIKFADTPSKDSAMQYIALGWGDKGFYMDTPTWAQLKVSTAVKAGLGLGGTAIHATYYKQMMEGADCIKLMLSRDQYQRLVRYISDSFKLDKRGHYINIKTRANYGLDDAFYEARGRYTIFYTCNTWTNGALKVCGQKACLWTVFDKGIFYQY